MMVRKRYLYLFILFVLLLFGVITMLTRDHTGNLPHQTVKLQAQPLYIGFDGTITPDFKGRLYFSNDRYLVRYDPATGTSEQLSVDGKLPLISQISISKSTKYVAFQSVTTTFADDLYTQVKSAGRNTDSPQWWLLDTQTQTYTLLPDGVKHVAWDDQDVLHVQRSDEIVALDARGVRTRTVTVKGVRSFELVGRSYLVNSVGGSVYLIDSSGKQQKSLGSNFKIVYLAPSSGEFISYTNGASDSLAVAHSKGKAYHLAASQEEPFSWDLTGQYFAYSDSAGLHAYDVTKKAINDYKISGQNIGHDGILKVIGPDKLLAQTTNGRLLLTNAASYTQPVQNTMVRLDNLTIEGFANANQFNVTKEGGITPDDRQKVYTELHNRGYDPNLLKIYFEGIILPQHPL